MQWKWILMTYKVNLEANTIIDGCVSMKFVNNQLSEFSVLEDCEVFFEGQNVFSDDFLQELKKKYTSVNKFGFTIFDEIGIALSDVETKEQKKAITVYTHGGWNDVLKLPG